jgi:acyl-CoA thioester hydrolase
MPSERKLPSVNEIRQLPADLTMTVPLDWEDRNGHVNVQYYLTLYELGGWQIMQQVGIDEHYLEERRSSVFDLEHHISYLAEINVGDTVSVHNRMLSSNSKLFQGILFVVNDTHDKVAATIEYLSVHIDLEKRRSAPFPVDVANKLGELLDRHGAMDWPSPACGLMNL